MSSERKSRKVRQGTVVSAAGARNVTAGGPLSTQTSSVVETVPFPATL